MRHFLFLAVFAATAANAQRGGDVKPTPQPVPYPIVVCDFSPCPPTPYTLLVAAISTTAPAVALMSAAFDSQPACEHARQFFSSQQPPYSISAVCVPTGPNCSYGTPC